ncbi:hypothetical protein F0562_001621 [Nyssa sinensis]|uniref:Uncharacterized protein n=1 Tax=Nyssa sinensis TaxID=561372 RepID=A0A5J5C7P2_9ASTE|nr:hypothetical protein F0562_001621 [Nyssa sinensis]
MAVLNQLILDGRSNGDTVIPVAKRHISRTVYMQVVPAGDKRAHLPSHPSINLDVDQNHSSHLIFVQHNGQIWSYGYSIAAQERRPHVQVLVSLIGIRQQRRQSNLLAAVRSEDVELVVVYSNVAVWVSRSESDLKIGGQEVGGRGVEGVDGGVLEDEARLCGPEDDPYQEDDEEDDDNEDEKDLLWLRV